MFVDRFRLPLPSTCINCMFVPSEAPIAVPTEGTAAPKVEDVPPPPGAIPLSKMKLLAPTDWDAFEKDRPSFAKEWDRIVGARR